jgi:hypothetical protein
MNIESIISNLLPEYECILPFEQKKVSFNPFRVRDAKNLAILLEEKNKNLILKSLVNLLKTNCKGINVDELCLADAEYLFLQMRAKSIEEELNLLINGNPVKVNITEIEHKNNFLSSEIEIFEGCYVKLRTPKIKDLLLIDLEDENAITNKSIKSICLKSEIYDIDKFLSDEAKQILDNLPLNIMSKIKKELNNQPELFVKLPSNDGVCEVAGPLTFFILR